MSREPRWARDGPSRRAPGRRLRRTHFSAARRASAASNDDGARGVWRSQTRMKGQALLVTFLWFGIPTIEKSDSPGKAKQKVPAELGNKPDTESAGEKERWAEAHPTPTLAHRLSPHTRTSCFAALREQSSLLREASAHKKARPWGRARDMHKGAGETVEPQATLATSALAWAMPFSWNSVPMFMPSAWMKDTSWIPMKPSAWRR